MGRNLPQHSFGTGIQNGKRMARGSKSGIKTLKSGRLSIKLTQQVKQVLLAAIELRLLKLRDPDDLTSTILMEIHKQMNTDITRLKLWKYEYLCLFEKDMIDLIPEECQALLIAVINPALRPIEMK